jgi:2-oxoglutarate ferredoxin oxidoreductase subunit delta
MKPKTKGVVLIPQRCKGCGFCIEFCPPGILARAAEMNSIGYHAVYVTDESKCTGCELCGLVCPDFAIGVREGQGEDGPETWNQENAFRRRP